MLALVAPERKGLYVVVKPFRFSGRDFVPGMQFDARRQDPSSERLNGLYREGCLSLPDRKADAAYRKERLKAMKNWQPPGPVKVPAAAPAPSTEPVPPVLPPPSDAQLRALESAVSSQAPAESSQPLFGEDHED